MWDELRRGNRKSFGLLQCKGETQESAFTLISLFKYKHVFLSSWQPVLHHAVLLGSSKHIQPCKCVDIVMLTTKDPQNLHFLFFFTVNGKMFEGEMS